MNQNELEKDKCNKRGYHITVCETCGEKQLFADLIAAERQQAVREARRDLFQELLLDTRINPNVIEELLAQTEEKL